MNINITGKNGFEPSAANKDFLINKIDKIAKLFKKDVIDEIRVVMKIYEKDFHKVEITVYTGGTQIRNEEKAPDLYVAITKCVNQLFQQIKKYKEKINKSLTSKGVKEIFRSYEHIDLEPSEIVRKKEIILSPISQEEAILNLELLKHDFYVYLDKDSNKVSVVYKTSSQKYSVIETTNAE